MTTKDTTPTATGVTEQRLAGLRRWNLALTLLHLAQAAVVVLIAGNFAITVTSSFPEGPPGSAAVAPQALFEVSIGWAVAAFLLLAALDHLLTGIVARRTYARASTLSSRSPAPTPG